MLGRTDISTFPRLKLGFWGEVTLTFPAVCDAAEIVLPANWADMSVAANNDNAAMNTNNVNFLHISSYIRILVTTIPLRCGKTRDNPH
ncbi:hypothetical protein SJDPG4_01665 [Porphyromonas gingivalis SJD4]|nr:hypothetical protein SJDPG4_01665 [Porphyromonas gingivalis SJD4]